MVNRFEFAKAVMLYYRAIINRMTDEVNIIR